MIAQVPQDGPVARLAGRLRTSVSLGILDAGTAAAELAGRPAAGPAFAAQRLLRGATNLGLVQGILPNQFSGAASPRLLWAKPAQRHKFGASVGAAGWPSPAERQRREWVERDRR
jgi:hypothetical protein